MRVVSMVPSWTETLIECGVNVVGRTRFCVHPQKEIESIPVVGGTKDLRRKKVADLKPDLLLLDKEENPKAFAENPFCQIYASHIHSIEDMAKECQALGARLHNEKLIALGQEYQWVSEQKNLTADPERIPGLIEWAYPPKMAYKKILYLIWREPYMTISQKTYIASVLKKIGWEPYLTSFDENYPKIELSKFSPEETLLWLSSEPFPFQKHLADYKKGPFPAALVDGENFSWFGIRSLRFLKREIERARPVL